MPTPRSDWKWYGYAGHFIGGSKCAFHLCTRIGDYLVSTVGDYRPNGKDKECLGAGEESFFETFIFDCLGEDKWGNPQLKTLSEIDGNRYADSLVAEKGHYEFCEKYASL